MRVFQIIVLAITCFFYSCGGDDPVNCTTSDFNNRVNEEIADVNAAGQAWATDPTQENCDAFKAAANAYIDAVEEFNNCDGLTEAQFDEAAAGARAALDAIGC